MEKEQLELYEVPKYQINLLKRCSRYCTAELKNIHIGKKDIAEMHRIARYNCKWRNNI